jgi:hypothetical protein
VSGSGPGRPRSRCPSHLPTWKSSKGKKDAKPRAQRYAADYRNSHWKRNISDFTTQYLEKHAGYFVDTITKPALHQGPTIRDPEMLRLSIEHKLAIFEITIYPSFVVEVLYILDSHYIYYFRLVYLAPLLPTRSN